VRPRKSLRLPRRRQHVLEFVELSSKTIRPRTGRRTLSWDEWVRR
jgi:hypothetical protein